MTFDFSTLTNSEMDALDWLRKNHGYVLVTSVPNKNHTDFLGSLTPGMSIFRRLMKKGLVLQTEEEPANFASEGEEPRWFTSTEMIEFKEGVREAYEAWLKAR